MSSLMTQITEQELARQAALEKSLDFMCQQLEQLDIVENLPPNIENKSIVINRAVDIRSACMIYIASHIFCTKPYLGTFGELPLDTAAYIT